MRCETVKQFRNDLTSAETVHEITKRLSVPRKRYHEKGMVKVKQRTLVFECPNCQREFGNRTWTRLHSQKCPKTPDKQEQGEHEQGLQR